MSGRNVTKYEYSIWNEQVIFISFLMDAHMVINKQKCNKTGSIVEQQKNLHQPCHSDIASSNTKDIVPQLSVDRNPIEQTWSCHLSERDAMLSHYQTQ